MLALSRCGAISEASKQAVAYKLESANNRHPERDCGYVVPSSVSIASQDIVVHVDHIGFCGRCDV